MEIEYHYVTQDQILLATPVISQVSSQTQLSDIEANRAGNPLGFMDPLSVTRQATGLDAWASRVKCPARFVSHLHDICIYMSCL